MRKRHMARLGGGTRRRVSIIGTALVASLVLGLGLAAPVLAKEPTGKYAVFKQCPRFTAGVNLCLYSQITGGVLTLNRLTVPIVNPVTLQFGVILNETIFEESVVGPLDGETLSPTPQPVPGGLSSLIDCDELPGKGFPGRARRDICRAMLDSPSRLTTVNETTELVGSASEIIGSKHNEEAEEGPSLTLSVRVHLENPLLGRECYIGTSTNPIVFALTDGETNPPPPNEPIRGSLGNVGAQDEFNLIEATDHIQVDNAFSAPAATGCGYGPFSTVLDSMIDNKIGLPSPAGYNTVIHSGYVNEATTVGVIASEQEEPHEKQSKRKRG